MRNRIITSTILVACMSLLSCNARGIIELSRADREHCDQLVARDGELLIAVLAAVDDFVGGVPGGDPKLQGVRAECGEHMKRWDQFVSEMYQKYGVSEETYRLDVFRGSFSPRVSGERTTAEADKSFLVSLGT